jgi:hypothetical protein
MGNVQRDVLGKTLQLTLAGVVVGTAASLAVNQLIASLLFGTSPGDLTTYAGMFCALFVVALASSYIPVARFADRSPSSAEGQLNRTKKAPLGYACLDEVQVWQTGGARSRNHKKMGCTAFAIPANCSANQDPALGTFSGPRANVFANCE